MSRWGVLCRSVVASLCEGHDPVQRGSQSRMPNPVPVRSTWRSWKLCGRATTRGHKQGYIQAEEDLQSFSVFRSISSHRSLAFVYIGRRYCHGRIYSVIIWNNALEIKSTVPTRRASTGGFERGPCSAYRQALRFTLNAPGSQRVDTCARSVDLRIVGRGSLCDLRDVLPTLPNSSAQAVRQKRALCCHAWRSKINS